MGSRRYFSILIWKILRMFTLMGIILCRENIDELGDSNNVWIVSLSMRKALD